jgi:regulator of RNase E activity RraA
MLPGLQALHVAPRGSVIVVNNLASESEALAGDIFVHDAIAGGLGGLIVNGAVRDVADLRTLGFPVFARHVTFVSAKTAVVPAREVPERVVIDGVLIEPGDWVFGDDDGLIAVAARFLSAVVSGAQIVAEREAELKTAIRSRDRLGTLCGLPDFLAGRSPLKFNP